jgi:hypothetical protein
VCLGCMATNLILTALEERASESDELHNLTQVQMGRLAPKNYS